MLTGTGVWNAMLRYGDPAEIIEATAEVESLGYTSALVADFGGDDLYGALDRLLEASATLTIGTGVLNIFMQPAAAANAWWHGLSPAHQARVMLGVGVSHGPLVGEGWSKPLATMERFLDELEVPAAHRSIAALGPKMQELARRESAGAFPYLLTAEHTSRTREALGDGKWIGLVQPVLLERDASTARDIAREHLQIHAGLPNYANNWKRAGFTDDDVATRSDRLIDALVAWGDIDAIATRIAEQRAAGADHIALDVMGATGLPRDAWRALAGV